MPKNPPAVAVASMTKNSGARPVTQNATVAHTVDTPASMAAVQVPLVITRHRHPSATSGVLGDDEVPDGNANEHPHERLLVNHARTLSG